MNCLRVFLLGQENREQRFVASGPVGRWQTQSSSIHQHFLSYFNVYFWVCLCGLFCHTSLLPSLLFLLAIVLETQAAALHQEKPFVQKKNKIPPPSLSWKTFSVFSFWFNLPKPNLLLYGCTSQSLCVVSFHFIWGYIPNYFGFPLQFSITAWISLIPISSERWTKSSTC